MTLQLMNEAFLAKITIIKFFHIAVNTYVPIFQGLDVVVAENDEQAHTHTHTHTGHKHIAIHNRGVTN